MRKKRLDQKLIATFSLLICMSSPVLARHIIGSDFYYICKGTGRTANTKAYEFSLTMYRDCSNNAQAAPYDVDATFGIYRFDGTRYIYLDQFTVNHTVPKSIKPDNNPCLIIPPNLCVEEASYGFSVDLPVINETYVIYYMRCCRNNTIINLVAPNNTGATFFIEISPEAQKTCNNSPRFKAFPPIVICAEFPFEVDQSATDAEGDSLIYEFCTPLTGGGNGVGVPAGVRGCTSVNPLPQLCSPPFDFVTFAPPYSTENPMGPGVLKLDRFSGKLEGLPRDLGQYVVGVCVKEYRQGILIGSIHRDFQFNVGICEQTVTAKIQADTSTGKSFTINYCGDRVVPFINLSERKEYIKNYYWEFKSKSKPNAPAITNTDRNAVITFPEPGDYAGVMIVNKNAIVCSDTALVNLKIIPSDIKADFEFTYDKCSSLPVQFKDKSTGTQTPVKSWRWDFMDGETASGKNPAHLFRSPGNYPVKLTVSDGKICKSESVKDLAYFPAPLLLDLLPDKYRACVPATIHFQNLSIPLDTSYLVEWDFGDGTHSMGLNADHTYATPGSFSVGLSVKAPSGCISKELFPAFVKIQEGPVADFSVSPSVLTSLNSTAHFTNLSRDAISYTWNFGDQFGSDLTNPSHSFRDTGLFNITLVARHQNGCVDTTLKQLEVLLNISYFLPNAFSPNNDGVNDIYLGNGSFAGIQDFKMTIFNRWGEIVFYSEDPFSGWNGKKHNKGPIEPNGVYVCTVQYKTNKGEPRDLKSFATLIR